MSAESPPYALSVEGVPVLTAPLIVDRTLTDAGVITTTTRATGTIYLMVDSNENVPTVQQIIEGRNAAGARAAAALAWVPDVAGLQPVQTARGLLQGATYWAWIVQTVTGGVSTSLAYASQFTLPGVEPPDPDAPLETLVSFYNRPEGANPKFGA